MNEYLIDESQLLNESDVEQKVIYPLITNAIPKGLGFKSIHVQTKLNLKKLPIEKRNNAKLYYPDYVIIAEGLPLIVVEVKGIYEDLTEAYREARLYALEMNSLFPEGINPCSVIIASNGRRLIAGSWDSQDSSFDIPIENWNTADEIFSNFIDLFSLPAIEKKAVQISNLLRTKVLYRRPINLLGGKHIQNQQVKNTFGESISIQYRHLFNPIIEDERVDIVSNAYVKVEKQMSHVDSIDKLIRKKIAPSSTDTTEIQNNIVPNEVIEKLKDASNYNNQVLLLVGSVGSGKSTFITYLKEIAISKALSTKLTWSRIDLNNAPVNQEEIYKWLKKSIIDDLLKQNNWIDIDSIEFIEQLYSKEITSFKKLATALLDTNSSFYKEQFFAKIQELRNDIDITLNSLIDFCIHQKGKELIIVLDNCDKRNLEEQLLMFEVANWLKENTKSIVFLPLRETTFDHFRNQKPLDTVIKDLIFRINPPSLEKVIYNRIKYAIRLSEKSTTNYYFLPNGFKVSYPSSDELYYLKSILKSLFQNKFFKRLISGLAGRDTRKGIEIFLDFCKSGHITESEIIQMKTSKGDFSIPNHIISRVFLRGNRLYYSDSDTKVRNLFYSNPSDNLPNPFVRVAILSWLNNRASIQGPSGIKGYFKVSQLVNELNLVGHSPSSILENLRILIKFSLITSESQDFDNIDLEELISINIPGTIHLDLIKNIDYLSSCAEDVWYNEENLANEIANSIANKNVYSHLSLQTNLSNSEILINYLKSYKEKFFSAQEKFVSDDAYLFPLNFDEILDDIERFKRSINLNSHKEIEPDTITKARILNIFPYGLICELIEYNQIGFISSKDIPNKNFYQEAIYHVNDQLEVKVVRYKQYHRKYDLLLVQA